MSDDELSNDETLAIIEQFKPALIKNKGPRRRRSNLEKELLKNGQKKSDLSPEELEKLRKKADADRKKRRRQEMSEEERRNFLQRENERKRLQRLKPSFNANRFKEAQRKKEKRRAMTPEEREKFRAKDALRKRLERLKKKLQQAKENGTEINNQQLLELENLKKSPNGTINSIIDTTLKPKRGRPRKDKNSNIDATPESTKKKNSVNKSKSAPKAKSDKEFRERLENCVLDLIYEPLLMDNKDELLKIVNPEESDLSTVKDKLDNVHSTILNKPIILQKVSKEKHEIMFNTPIKFLKSPEVNIDDILKAETPPLMLLDSGLSDYETGKKSPDTRCTETLEAIREEIHLNEKILLEINEVNGETFFKPQNELVLELEEKKDENILKSEDEVLMELDNICEEDILKTQNEIVLKVKEISEENILSQEPVILELKDISLEDTSKPQDEIVLRVKQMVEDTHSNDQDKIILETVNPESAGIEDVTNMLDYPMVLVDEQGNEISTLMPINSRDAQNDIIKPLVAPARILSDSKIETVEHNNLTSKKLLPMIKANKNLDKIESPSNEARFYAWNSVFYLRQKINLQYSAYDYKDLYVNLPNPPDKAKYEEEFSGYQNRPELCAKYMEEKKPQYTVLNTVVDCIKSLKSYFEKDNKDFNLVQNDDIELTCNEETKKDRSMDLIVAISKNRSKRVFSIFQQLYIDSHFPNLTQLLKLTPPRQFKVPIDAHNIFGHNVNALPFETQAEKYCYLYNKLFNEENSIESIFSIKNAIESEENNQISQEIITEEDSCDDKALVLVDRRKPPKDFNIEKFSASKVKKKTPKRLVVTEKHQNLTGALRSCEVEVTVLEPIYDESIDMGIEDIEMEILLAEPQPRNEYCLEEAPSNELEPTDLNNSLVNDSNINILDDNLTISGILNISQNESGRMEHLFNNIFYSDHVPVDENTAQCPSELNLSEAHIEAVENALIDGSFLTISTNHDDILCDVYNPFLKAKTDKEENPISDEFTTPPLLSHKKQKKKLKTPKSSKDITNSCKTQDDLKSSIAKPTVDVLKTRDESKTLENISASLIQSEDNLSKSQNLPTKLAIEHPIKDNNAELMVIRKTSTESSGLINQVLEKLSEKEEVGTHITNEHPGRLSVSYRTEKMTMITPSEVDMLVNLIDEETSNDDLTQTEIIDESNDNQSESKSTEKMNIITPSEVDILEKLIDEESSDDDLTPTKIIDESNDNQSESKSTEKMNIITPSEVDILENLIDEESSDEDLTLTNIVEESNDKNSESKSTEKMNVISPSKVDMLVNLIVEETNDEDLTPTKIIDESNDNHSDSKSTEKMNIITPSEVDILENLIDEESSDEDLTLTNIVDESNDNHSESKSTGKINIITPSEVDILENLIDEESSDEDLTLTNIVEESNDKNSESKSTEKMNVISPSEVNMLVNLIDEDNDVTQDKIVEKSNDNHSNSKSKSTTFEGNECSIEDDIKGTGKPVSQLKGLMHQLFDKIAREKEKEETKLPNKNELLLEKSLRKHRLSMEIEGLVQEEVEEVQTKLLSSEKMENYTNSVSETRRTAIDNENESVKCGLHEKMSESKRKRSAKLSGLIDKLFVKRTKELELEPPCQEFLTHPILPNDATENKKIEEDCVTRIETQVDNSSIEFHLTSEIRVTSQTSETSNTKSEEIVEAEHQHQTENCENAEIDIEPELKISELCSQKETLENEECVLKDSKIGDISIKDHETIIPSANDTCNKAADDIIENENHPISVSLGSYVDCNEREVRAINIGNKEKPALEENSLEDELCDLEVSKICQSKFGHKTPIVSENTIKDVYSKEIKCENVTTATKESIYENEDSNDALDDQTCEEEPEKLEIFECSPKNGICLDSSGVSSMLLSPSIEAAIDEEQYTQALPNIECVVGKVKPTLSSSIKSNVDKTKHKQSSASESDETDYEFVTRILNETKSRVQIYESETSIEDEISYTKPLAQSPVLCVDDFEDPDEAVEKNRKKMFKENTVKVRKQSIHGSRKMRNDAGFSTNYGSIQHQHRIYNNDISTSSVFYNRSKKRTKFYNIDGRKTETVGLNSPLNYAMNSNRHREDVNLLKTKKRKRCYYDIPDSMYDKVSKEIPCEFPIEIAYKKMKIGKI